MSDYFLRDLERCFRECGSPEAGVGFAVGLQRAGRRDDGVGVLVDLFRLNPENGVVKFAWVSNFGLPFVERNPSDAQNTVRFYNVMHKGVNDSERVPYVFTWDLELFKHKDRNRGVGGCDYFTQERLASILANGGMQKRPPTASAVHSHVLALEEMLRLGVSSAQVQRARGFLRMHFEQWLLTWTMVDYDKPAVIQDWDLQEQRTDVDIRGVNGYLRDLNAGENRAGDLVKNSILCAEQSVEEVDRMYNSLLGISNGAWVWGLDSNATGKRDVVLGRDDVGFSIDCCIGSNGAARLVAKQYAKDFGRV